MAIQHTLGELESNEGNPEAGLELIGQAYISRQLALGTEHPDTLDSLILLALTMTQVGHWENAVRTLEWGLSICEAALGEHHRTTARVLNALARLYATDEATHDRARSLYERALATNERLLSPDL